MRNWWVLVFSWLCLLPLQAREPSFVYKPEVMSVEIGGAFGPSYEINYDQRTLRYYAARDFFVLKNTRPVTIKPTAQQWQTFFDDLNRLQVWKWKRHYVNADVADGTAWSVYIVYPTRDARDVISSGSNAYPPNFKAFLAAMRRLVGERTFE